MCERKNYSKVYHLRHSKGIATAVKTYQAALSGFQKAGRCGSTKDTQRTQHAFICVFLTFVAFVTFVDSAYLTGA
jgi:hypothetical protein